jgi:hypothetical protein
MGSEPIREPLSEPVIRSRIREGKLRRRTAKQGTIRRLLGNCKKLAVASVLFTCLAASQFCFVTQHFFGSSRPDLLEVFAGAAEVSLQFSRRGWFVLEPVDIKYGWDLSDVEARDDILRMIDEYKPRLVTVAYPCRFWSPLSETNYRTPQRRRLLSRLRKREEPFLDLTEKIFDRQIKRGDDALGESPLLSRSFKCPTMRRVLGHPLVYTSVTHGCRYGFVNFYDGRPLKKPTLWFSTSPEICDQLSKKCPNSHNSLVHVHGECQGGKTTTYAGRYTPEIGRAIHKGFLETLKRKDPGRLRSLIRGVSRRLSKGDDDTKQLKWTQQSVDRLLGKHDHVVCAVDSMLVEPPSEAPAAGSEPLHPDGSQEGTAVHLAGDGIVFEVPPGHKLDGVVKGLIKKIHCNLGHPSKDDLKRFLKRGGSSPEVLQAVDWVKCTACAKLSKPRLHRNTRMPPHELQFNDQIYLDCFHVKDFKNEGHWFLSILDRATMYHQVTYLKRHTPESFRHGLFEFWVRWAGTPEEVTVDLETGFVSKEFVQALGEAGIQLAPIAGQAHWQNGKIERHGAILKEMMKKTIQQTEASGEEELTWLGIEITGAKNSLIREHGFSPSQLLFGREPRYYGEIVRNGEPCSFHFEVGNSGSQVARRMRFRYNARQSFVQAQASEMLNRTARNKTRPWVDPQIGDTCFFFRELRKKGLKGKQPSWLGPSLVVGKQGNNLWVVFGGRCYLVAQEQCREAVGEELLFGRPEVQEALAIFRDDGKLLKGQYVDLTGCGKPPHGSVEAPLGDVDVDSDEEMTVGGPPNPLPRRENPPEEVLGLARNPGWFEDQLGNPVHSCRNAYAFRTLGQQYDMSRLPFRTSWGFMSGSWFLLEDEVRWSDFDDVHGLIPDGPADVLVTVFKSRSRKQMCLDSVPECIKKQRVGHVFVNLKDKKAQRALEKEIPYSKISQDQMPAFQEAIRKEWQSWQEFHAAEPLSLQESEKVIQELPQRVLRSRYVLRNKNAGLVDDKGSPLALRAKARLCIQGQFDPDSASGNIQLDAPTVQHTSLLVFLHCVISFGWLDNWFSGDISSAFLQGKPSSGQPLYMYQPSQGIPGCDKGQIFKLIRPVYGRPDAPRAWYEALSGFIMEVMKYERSIIDPALFIKRDGNGNPISLIVIHVDDLMVAGCDCDENRKCLLLLKQRFPFGEWEGVAEKSSGVTYCGKEIVVVGNGNKRVIHLRQQGFVDGRLESIPVDRSRSKDSPVNDEEKGNFRSVLGSLQWLSTQSRGDISFSVNQLQKRVNKLTVGDLDEVNKVVRFVKKHPLSLVFHDLGRDVAVVSWHDASLYNSLGVELEDQEDEPVHGFKDKMIFSQKGCIAGFVKKSDLDRTDPVRVNFATWKSKTNKRVIESSFAAETHGATMGHGTGHHLRALYVEICVGSWSVKGGEDTPWNDHTPLMMVTDCKSVYDSIRSSSHSIGDKGNALNVTVLRQLCAVDFGKPLDGEKAYLMWVPTRHQCADGLTKGTRSVEMHALLQGGTVMFHGRSAKELRKSERDYGQCQSCAS